MAIRISGHLVLNAVVLSTCFTVCAAHEAWLPTAPADTTSAETEAFVLPQARLSPITGFDDDEAWLSSIDGRIDDAVHRAEETDSAEERARHLTVAANLLLAHRLEPACTRTLLLDERPSPASGEQSRLLLDRADELLNRAAEALFVPLAGARGSLPGVEPSGEPVAESAQTRTALDALRAFSGALRAVLLAAPEDDDSEAMTVIRQASIRLAPLLEERDASAASAAKLWQAALRTRLKDWDRARAMLDLPLTDPDDESMPYAFFMRLLRCRLAGARGGHAAAVTLLTQLEERCQEWFKVPEERAAAVRTVHLMQMRSLADWADALAAAGADEERAWCQRRFEALRARSFNEAPADVFRLQRAVPVYELRTTNDE